MVMPFIVMVAVVRIVRIMQTGVLDSVGTGLPPFFIPDFSAFRVWKS